MFSEFDIPQKSVLLTTLPNLNDKKNRQINEISLQSCVKLSLFLCYQTLWEYPLSPLKPRPLPSVTCQSKSPPLPETWMLRLRAFCR